MSDELARKMLGDLGVGGEEKKVEKKTTSYGYGSSYGGGWDYGAGHGGYRRKEKRGKERQGRLFDDDGHYMGPKARDGVPFDDDLSVMNGGDDEPTKSAEREEQRAPKPVATAQWGSGFYRWDAFVNRSKSIIAKGEREDGNVVFEGGDLDSLATSLQWLIGDALEEVGVLWRSEPSQQLKKLLKEWVRSGLMVTEGGQTLPVKER